MNFKLEILANFKFWGYQICQQTFHKIIEFHLHFRLKSKWEDKTKALVKLANIASQTLLVEFQITHKIILLS